MTSEDVRAELDRDPFVSLRLHLVSGKTVDVMRASDAWMLQNAILVFQSGDAAHLDGRYDVISLRNIERLEQLGARPVE